MTAAIRVLHVDDDVADLVATFLTWKGDGVTVETTTSADEALDRIRDDTFDCVVSDHEMPGMDGIELGHRGRPRVGGPHHRCRERRRTLQVH